jgi:hypothetical protein
VLGPTAVHRERAGGNLHLEAQWALARGDTAGVRERLERLGALAAVSRPGDQGGDGVFLEASIRLAIGDSAGAIGVLDESLGALPSAGRWLATDYSATAGLARCLALRAELAGRAGDAAVARRLGGTLAELWRSADRSLQPTVRRLVPDREGTQR